MHFFVNNEYKVIFGWSGKCGCSHVKKIYYFFCNNIEKELHNDDEYEEELPENIEDYTSILFIRNPYKRLVSGFLDKYSKSGVYIDKFLVKYDIIKFDTFIDELIKGQWSIIDYHHFTPQTTEQFNKTKIIKSKSLILYDIESINYEYLEKLFNKKIPEQLLNFKGGHERKVYNDNFNGDSVYNLDINKYIKYNVPINNFYNKELKDKVYNFYEKDFLFFEEFEDFEFDYEK
jgi:hypothetical protein